MDEVGYAINEDLANVANKALTCTSKSEKAKQMQEKHNRPKHVETLQVLKVDEKEWGQLKRNTKSYDCAIQKCQLGTCMVMVLTEKTLVTLKQLQPQIADVNDSVEDIFKCLRHCAIK